VVNLTSLSGDLSVRDFAYLVFKRKYQIIGVFLATLIFTTVAIYLKPRDYTASATVYLVRNLSPIAAVSPSTLNIVLDRKEVLNSEVDLVTSKAVAERVADLLLERGSATPPRPRREPPAWLLRVRAARMRVSEFVQTIGLADPPPGPREALVAGLMQSIEAKPAVNSNFITISFTSADPQYAAQAVNAFTEVYLEQRLQLFKRPGLEEFYTTQVERAAASLAEIEQRISELKAETGVITEDEQLRLLLQELSGLNDELNQVRGEAQELAERKAALEERVNSQPDSMMASRVLQRNPNISDLEKKSIDLAAERALELNRFKPDSAVIHEIDRSIARIQAAAADEPETVVSSESLVQNTLRTTLLTDLYRTESDYSGKLARERTLVAQIEALVAKIHEVDGNASELRRLSAEAANASKVYTTYVAQREDARIARETDPGVTNVQVISHATAPARPTYPRSVMISLGAFLGLFMGFALAFVSELFSHTLNRREDIERELGLPVLGAIPESAAVRQPI
jgi:uncharacterized protein involved in exopolysaccharide biosynthesis